MGLDFGERVKKRKETKKEKERENWTADFNCALLK
jgi:hypothetical protein